MPPPDPRPTATVDPNALVDGPTICAAFGINRATWRSWTLRHAARLPVAGRGPRRVALYRWSDVCAIAMTNTRTGRRTV